MLAKQSLNKLKAKGLNKLKAKGVASMFLLSLWCLWKERNDRIFNRKLQSVMDTITINSVKTEAALWGQVDALDLGAGVWN